MTAEQVLRKSHLADATAGQDEMHATQNHSMQQMQGARISNIETQVQFIKLQGSPLFEHLL